MLQRHWIRLCVSIWYAFNLKFTFNTTLKTEKVAWRNVALINVPQITGIFLVRLFFFFFYLFISYIYFFFYVCLWATFECDFWIIIFFCFTFSGWGTWNVTLQASNLKQALTINNISTIFLLKSMSSNTIQAYNVFERYQMSAIFTFQNSTFTQHLMWAIFSDKSRATVCWT